MSSRPPDTGSGKTSDALGKAFREQLTGYAAVVVTRMATILRTAGTHDPNNAAWKIHLNALAGAVGPILRVEKAAKLVLRNGQFTLNEAMIRSGYQDFTSIRYLADEFHKLGIGWIEFRGLPDELEVKKLAYALRRLAETPDMTHEQVTAELTRENVRRIAVGPEEAAEEIGAGARDPRVHGVFVFLKGIHALREVMEGLRTGRSVGFKRAKRFVHSAVDLLAIDPGLLLALTSIKNYGGDYLSNHSVNVCLLSLVVGKRLGFSRKKLADLGLAALLRDVGKATVPKEILEKQGQLTPEEWAQMKSFPFAAVMGLLRFRGFNDSLLRQVIVAFEHKFRSVADDRYSARDFSLFSRIAQLADAFDAMTTPRPYRTKPMTPDEALRTLIIDRHATRADPTLIKTFIHAIGLYPVGTVLLLDTNEIAGVAAPPSDLATLARPRVRLIATHEGEEVYSAPIVDLTEYDEFADPPRYTRSIAGTLDRWNYGINVARHLLSDESESGLELA